MMTSVNRYPDHRVRVSQSDTGPRGNGHIASVRPPHRNRGIARSQSVRTLCEESRERAFSVAGAVHAVTCKRTSRPSRRYV
jgi:hypothetical protein